MQLAGCAPRGSRSGRATEDDLEATWQFRRLPEVSEWLTRLPSTLESTAEQYLDPVPPREDPDRSSATES